VLHPEYPKNNDTRLHLSITRNRKRATFEDEEEGEGLDNASENQRKRVNEGETNAKTIRRRKRI
jgi:hypothetical protein